jgi:hypothetical protein
MTAPNTYQGGVSVITSPAFAQTTNFVIAIRPALACFTPRYLQQVCSPTVGVNYLSFNAKRNNTLVNLTWSTGAEVNNKGFYIERLMGSGTWETVGYVASKSANGISNEATSYQYSDMNLSKSVTQYRLRQVDLDNKSSLSEIRTVEGLNGKGSVVIYPNPSSGDINIAFNDNSTRDVSVFDMSGKTIKQLRGITSSNVKIENLQAGMYTIRIIDTGSGMQTVEKVIVNK